MSEMFEEWVKHPYTEKLLKHLVERQQDLSESWIDGAFTYENADTTLQTMVGAMGQAQGLGIAYDVIKQGRFLENEGEQ